MFFVRKDNIATAIGTQKEYAACQRRDIDFFADRSAHPDHKVWHYLWPRDKVEPSIRDSVRPAANAPAPDPVVGEEDYGAHESGDPEFYIWSQEVEIGNTVGDPVISEYRGDPDGWHDVARQRWTAAHVAPVGSGG